MTPSTSISMAYVCFVLLGLTLGCGSPTVTSPVDAGTTVGPNEANKRKQEGEQLKTTGKEIADKTKAAPKKESSLGGTKDGKQPINEKEPIDARKGVWEEDGVRVSVISVSIDHARGVNPLDNNRPFVSKEKYLLVRLRLDNLTGTRKIDWKGFGVSVKDNFGNSYETIQSSDLQFAVRLDGYAPAQSIYPGKSVEDLVIFQTPVEKATSFRLEVRGEGISRKTESPPHFYIPPEMIKR